MSDPVGRPDGVAQQAWLAAACAAFGEAAKHFGGDFSGRFVASCGMDRRTGAYPLAAAINGAAALGIDAYAEQIKARVKSGYCDVMVNDLDEALRLLKNAVRKRQSVAVGLAAYCEKTLAAMASRGVVPDLLIHDSLAHDPGNASAPPESILALQKFGTIVSAGLFRDYLAPVSAEGFGLFYCTAQPGQVIDIRRIDALALELFSSDKSLCRWVNGVRSRIRLQDPPTRVYWLSAPQQSELTAAIEQGRARGELKGSVTIGVRPTDFL